MSRALSVAQVLRSKKETFDLSEEFGAAFGEPERVGVWFVWGNSGNGKSSFVMQLCKELTRFGKVAYNSLEEGDSLTMKNSLLRFHMDEVDGDFILLPGESMEELDKRLSKRRSPDFVVIDSFQYTQLSYKRYIKLKEKHRDKLLIFVSHADGRNPAGRAARSVMYDSTLKIFVEGYKAFSKGRFIGPKGYYTIWDKGAARYWGDKKIK